MQKNAKTVTVGKAINLKVTTAGIAASTFVSRGMPFNRA
jgi:hypothetical protein